MSRLRIVVVGYVVRGPLAGFAWHHLQYVLGFGRLGHDVYYLEDSDDYPSCYDPQKYVISDDPTYGLRFLERTLRRIAPEFATRWGYFDAGAQRWYGPLHSTALEILSEADLLVNLSGVNPLRPWFQSIPRRILIDTDPGFTQVRHLTDASARALALQHTGFFTFGENIGMDSSRVPDDGLAWLPTRQPVVLDSWEFRRGHPRGRYTTVMQWDSYKTVQFEGVRLGMKSQSFQAYMDLPHRAPAVFELALGSSNAPREELRGHGWRLRDPLAVSRSVATYQDYIEQSKGEFAIAKQGYVTTRTGWFSERSTGYMAMGRPAVLQDTGFSSSLPTGSGLLAFTSADEAVAAIEEVNARYAHHCEAARAIAEEYFASDRILSHLLERSMG